MSKIEEETCLILEQFDAEEIETIEDIDVKKIFLWSVSIPPYPPPIPSNTAKIINIILSTFGIPEIVMDILKSRDFFMFVKEIVEKERTSPDILISGLRILFQLINNHLLSNEIIEQYFVKSHSAASTTPSSSSSSSAVASTFGVCDLPLCLMDLTELENGDVTREAVLCLVALTMHFPMSSIDPIVAVIITHTCHRAFIDAFLTVLNDGKPAEEEEFDREERRKEEEKKREEERLKKEKEEEERKRKQREEEIAKRKKQMEEFDDEEEETEEQRKRLKEKLKDLFDEEEGEEGEEGGGKGEENSKSKKSDEEHPERNNRVIHPKGTFSLIASFFLHILSIGELCTSFCFGNSLIVTIDILLRLVEQMDTANEEAFTLLMCLDSLLHNSEYRYLTKPRYKQEDILTLMKEFADGEYPEETSELASQIILSNKDIFSKE
ncbi:putative Chromatin assembly factor 1 complex p150 subunit [Monocercomonoides exilis]|uniref:putative Chromatin assembly factor 1 complex p150 subunit n=1 Tax=Monocercomonoides exilis TaxID=2049356 RepID=UPI0035595EA6|nr:putative Chromatin assembly factor 1 complex p150 subunit [Monocercomonoides exilis]|eukprot:MONOS_10027.1-p1 / transcript=MONOS_10027.1 / gene=MONOS_10027 / organism=Monocercomonoides_exilis_PA203 / gene_product=Chromatin assembly factor 1 complex p150 subunit / transcript_product=Chromatin assembly factor 1 complex p150 subunit / location=Mono_scaffold00438:12019-13958(+) / protein_length=438 / sequence_SO=supercontig / SO=protein_coding / is_pseudo=false